MSKGEDLKVVWSDSDNDDCEIEGSFVQKSGKKI